MIVYNDRFYRQWMVKEGLERFEVKIKESDLLILCDTRLEDEALAELSKVRLEIESAIERDPVFLTTLVPHDAAPGSGPAVVEMAKAARAWNVGPMASVAGAVAERVARKLLEKCETVIVENGGDIYFKSDEPVTFGLFAGFESPFSDKLAFRVDGKNGASVCTSSGRVGPSLSFGKADAVVTVAPNGAFADAAATAIANRIGSPEDVEPVIMEEKKRGALDGLVACCGEKIGFWGDITLVKRRQS